MSTTKHQPMPTYATSRPPIIGPTRTPICIPRLVRLLAAVIWSWRTVRGISASREGRCIDEDDASRPETTKITHTLGDPRKALTASTAMNDACAIPVQISSLRRSTWSASAPPYSPKTTSGTSSTRPMAPTAKLEPVSV